MSDAKHHSLMQKTYQVLFLIYAPVAIISMLLSAFSDTFWTFIFVTSVAVAGISVFVGIVMCIQYWRHREAIRRDKEEHIPYMVRHRFVILYIPITIGSLLICSYYLFDKYVKPVEFYDVGQYQQIAVLFPITNSVGASMEDAERVKAGLGAFLMNHPDLLEDYHITIFDHQNRYTDELEQYVIHEMKQETQYFICAYSDVCSKLGENFEDLQSRAERVGESIIVTTLSSSMRLPLRRNQFYRFFVRNKEEANALANYALNRGIKTASVIATDDAYGRDAAEQFQESWEERDGKFVPGLFVDPALAVDITKVRVEQSQMLKEKPGAIFVAHYQNINPALQSIESGTTLLFSANYQQNNLAELVAAGAVRESLIVALPRYKVTRPVLTNTAGAFLYMTLEKLIRADQKAAGSLAAFHDHWQQEDTPTFLKFKSDGDADFKVRVEALPYAQDLHSQPRSLDAGDGKAPHP